LLQKLFVFKINFPVCKRGEEFALRRVAAKPDVGKMVVNFNLIYTAVLKCFRLGLLTHKSDALAPLIQYTAQAKFLIFDAACDRVDLVYRLIFVKDALLGGEFGSIKPIEIPRILL
jgi:hypothetical protein